LPFTQAQGRLLKTIGIQLLRQDLLLGLMQQTVARVVSAKDFIEQAAGGLNLTGALACPG